MRAKIRRVLFSTPFSSLRLFVCVCVRSSASRTCVTWMCYHNLFLPPRGDVFAGIVAPCVPALFFVLAWASCSVVDSMPKGLFRTISALTFGRGVKHVGTLHCWTNRTSLATLFCFSGCHLCMRENSSLSCFWLEAVLQQRVGRPMCRA